MKTKKEITLLPIDEIDNWLKNNHYGSLDQWLIKEDYLLCKGCSYNPTGCGWIDHEDNYINPIEIITEHILELK